jgi:hypothetical protein
MASDIDLAALLSQNLQLSQTVQTQAPVQVQLQTQQQQPQQPAQPSAPIVYASTHYIPSAHLHRRPASTPLPQPSPALPSESPSDDDLIHTLMSHNIHPASLLPAQRSLFANASPEQRLRLLELWRIAGPGPHVWSPTSVGAVELNVASEEEAAKARLEAQLRDRRASAVDSGVGESDADMDMCGSEADNGYQQQQHAEPYVLSGYEMLAARDYAAPQETMLRESSSRYNRATDPVFKGNGADSGWGSKNVEDMENQYGAFQMRDFVDGQDDGMMF